MCLWTGNSEICRADVPVQVQGQQSAIELGRVDVPVQRPSGRIFSSLGDGQPFALFRPLVDWVSPTHIMEGNLLYSVYCLKVNL